MELGVWKRAFSFSAQQEETCLACPTESDATLLPQRVEEKIPSCAVTAQPKGHCHNSVNEKSLFFELCFLQ